MFVTLLNNCPNMLDMSVKWVSYAISNCEMTHGVASTIWYRPIPRTAERDLSAASLSRGT